MILSFSVPDNNPKYSQIINWYRSQSNSERSQEFRKIFLMYLTNSQQINENKITAHISHNVEIKRIESNISDNDDDFDLKLDNIGIRR